MAYLRPAPEIQRPGLRSPYRDQSKHTEVWAKNSSANHRCINKVWEENLLHRQSDRSDPAEVGALQS